jgi:ectoine hydroxylase-related dioxygenase (phytanoyl-CoA dioxygenase family)
MKNYFTDKKAMDTPWVESPFFYKILEQCDYTDSEKELLIKYHEDGYVVIDLNITDDYIEQIRSDIDTYVTSGNITTQADGYHYTENPRVFEAWKYSKNVLELARNKKIHDTLKLLYNRKPMPFQTINFLYGSGQPLHQDSIHFYTQPERWMVGTWTALEDMKETNGPLNIVPGSHKWPHYNFQDLNLETPEFGKQFENYSEYENFLVQLLESKGLQKKQWIGKKGQCLIWAANLLHGGADIINKDETRFSQATHFYFEGCEHYYSPLFSNTRKGMYADKDLSTKNILNHII